MCNALNAHGAHSTHGQRLDRKDADSCTARKQSGHRWGDRAEYVFFCSPGAVRLEFAELVQSKC